MWGPHGYTVRHGVMGTLLGIAPTPPPVPMWWQVRLMLRWMGPGCCNGRQVLDMMGDGCHGDSCSMTGHGCQYSCG